MKNLKKILKEVIPSFVILGGVSLFLGASIYSSKIGRIDHEKIPRTYQGYHLQGRDTLIVFDPEPYTQREGPPELIIKGNPRELGIKGRGTQYILREIGRTNYSLLLEKLGTKNPSLCDHDVILKAEKVEDND